MIDLSHGLAAAVIFVPFESSQIKGTTPGHVPHVFLLPPGSGPKPPDWEMSAGASLSDLHIPAVENDRLLEGTKLKNLGNLCLHSAWKLSELYVLFPPREPRLPHPAP